MPMEDGKPLKMNESFVLMYLLSNSDSQLKIQLMNLVKNLMPIPLFITEFKNIFDINLNDSLNEEIIWILRKGITICSIGFHNHNDIKIK